MKPDTLLAHAGRDPQRFEGMVNPPVARASTILHESMASFTEAASNKHTAPYYGRYGTATSKLLTEACAQLDGAAGAVLYPSGLAAIVGALNTVLRPGGHLLMVDSVYGPVRDYCDAELKDLGITTTYYPPDTNGGIERLVRPETQAIYCESPGSHTFEIQDLPAIGRAAASRGIPVLIDNTWATPYFFKPLSHGADIAIQAATKYLAGHSDVMLGVVTCKGSFLSALQRSSALHGNCVSADDCYLALRGMRTLGVRLRQHFESAMRVTTWLQSRPEVKRILYPPLAAGPEQAVWARDFTGASGLFGVEFDEDRPGYLDDLADSLKLFGIGVSWGGYESLVLPTHVKRTHAGAAHAPLLRFHIGLEDPEDLIADLTQALDSIHRRHASAKLSLPKEFHV